MTVFIVGRKKNNNNPPDLSKRNVSAHGVIIIICFNLREMNIRFILVYNTFPGRFHPLTDDVRFNPDDEFRITFTHLNIVKQSKYVKYISFFLYTFTIFFYIYNPKFVN